jgi:hypothetical protein
MKLVRIATLVCLVPVLGSPVLAAQAPSPDPDGARIFTDDIGRFWEAFDQAGPAFPAETFQKVYLGRGSAGLRDFLKLRIQSAEALAKTVRAHPRYYASIRDSTGRIREMEKSIRASFYALEHLVPEAVFPDVYFVVGALSSGGTVSDQGLLIGAEMYGRTPGMPAEELSGWLKTVLAPVESIPHIVAHELIHYQQKYPETEPTLLSQSIREGSADFLAEMISGRHINAAAHAYAVPRRTELWREFQGKMHGKDFAGWLYSSSGDRPNDLGYWMGYEITQAFYDKATDKHRALKEILEIKDFDAFLVKSGYAERFTPPKTVP